MLEGWESIHAVRNTCMQRTYFFYYIVVEIFYRIRSFVFSPKVQIFNAVQRHTVNANGNRALSINSKLMFPITYKCTMSCYSLNEPKLHLKHIS